MSKAKGVRAGKAYIELGVHDALTRGLRSAQRQLNAFGSRIRNIGLGVTAASGAVLAPLAAAVTSFSSRGDAIAKAAKRIGISASALSQLGFAAEQSGSSVEALEAGLLRFSRLLGEAARGNQTAQRSFAAIGLSFEKLLGLSVEDRFAAVAEALRRISDSAIRTSAVFRIFGRGGAALIPLLNEGATGIARLREEADRLGLTIDSTDAAGAEELNDAMNRVRRTLRAVTMQVGAALAPTVTTLANRVAGVVSNVVAWAKKNRELIASTAKMVALVAGFGGSLVVTGVAIQTFAFALGGLASLVSAVTGAFGALISIVAAIVSPLGALTAAIVAAGAAMVYLSGVTGKVVEYLRGSFESLSSLVADMFSGFADAMISGDIELAAEVLWAGLKAIWEAGAAGLRQVWLSTKKWFVGIVVDALAVILKAGNRAWGSVAQLGISAVYGLRVAWRTLVDFILSSFLRVAGLLERIWNRLRGLFDASFDAAAANMESLARQTAGLEQISQQTEDAKDQLARWRSFRLDANRLITDAAEEEISRAHVESLGGDEEDERVRESRRKLDEARKKLDEFREKARTARLEEEERRRQNELIPPDFAAPAIDAMQSVQRRLSTLGTFSIVNLAQIAGEDADKKKTAKAAEATAENTRQMLQLMQRSRLVFS